MLQRSLLDGVIYGAYDGETLATALQLRPSYIGTPDWQQITIRHDSGLAGTASSLTYGTRALLAGTTYGILSTGAYGRLHRNRFTGASIVGRYRRSFAVLYASDFNPAWTVQDTERVSWAAENGPTWAVDREQEFFRWTPVPAPEGWTVQDTERIAWAEAGVSWTVQDTERIAWAGTVTGDVLPGAWQIEDTEIVRWLATVGTRTECTTGDGVPPSAGAGELSNSVY